MPRRHTRPRSGDLVGQDIQRIADTLSVEFLDLVELKGNQRAIQSILKAAEDGEKVGKRLVWKDDSLCLVDVEPFQKILNSLGKLNAQGQQEAVKRVAELTEILCYRADDPQSQEGKDTTPTTGGMGTAPEGE